VPPERKPRGDQAGTGNNDKNPDRGSNFDRSNPIYRIVP